MIIFACDLDNTLISSKRTDNDICVEIIDNKKNSFISKEAYELLVELMKKVVFIPVTTRSVEQYKRISLFNDKMIIPPYAIMCHGGKLLECSKDFNIEWQNATDLLVQKSKNELEKALQLILNDKECEKARWVNDTFIFTKSANPEVTSSLLSSQLDLSRVNISYHGKKLYVFPKGLDKGMAIERLRDMFSPSKVISAGDSIMDLDMLNHSDFAYTPTESLLNLSTNKNISLTNSNADTAYEILKSVYKIV